MKTHREPATTAGAETPVPICGGPLDGGTQMLSTPPERELRSRPVLFLDGLTGETISNPKALQPRHRAYGYRLVRKGQSWRYDFSGVEANPPTKSLAPIVAMLVSLAILVGVCVAILPFVFASPATYRKPVAWITVVWVCGVPTLIGVLCGMAASRRKALHSSGHTLVLLHFLTSPLFLFWYALEHLRWIAGS